MKLPQSYYNNLSFVGTIIAGIMFFMILFLFFISVFMHDTSSYLGLFIYIILPVFFVFGLLLIPIGMYFEKKKQKGKKEEEKDKKWPVIDFNLRNYRNAFVIFGIGTIFFLFLTGIGSYEAFHYTESVEFCGTLCHEVMEPENIAYQYSPHAKVTCVECHVGEGAGWYVKSKLSGLRQVYGVLTNNFNRPIETPIANLRPARETCEKCHWPEKFYNRQIRHTKHYLTDSLNTEWNISMQMKIGPSHETQKLSEGIHWHINPDIKIEYIAKKDDRKVIPYVKYTNLVTGEEIIYQDTVKPIKKKRLSEAEPRGMDCMDCHNRPSHHYFTPQEFIDISMANGDMSSDIPYIKHIAMEVLKDPFENKDTAMLFIENSVRDFYKQEHPAVWESSKEKIELAITEIKRKFNQNIFPAMGASWDSYPDYLGHKVYDGCFRCHTGKHVAENGRTISRDCNLCHSIVSQGPKGNEVSTSINDYLDFKHPVDIKEEWKNGDCTDCHRYLY